MSKFVGVTEEAERIADSKLSVKYKHIVSKCINHTFSLLCTIYAFPISLLSFLSFANDFYGIIVGVGILFNTMLIIIGLHIFNLLTSIKAAEIAFISFWICMALFLMYEHFLIPKCKQKIKAVVDDESTHSIIADMDAAMIHMHKLSPYEQSVFRWFHSTKSYLGKIPKEDHPHYDGIVFHYVLMSALISITSGYVIDGIIQILNGVKIISTYSDLYEYIGIVAANVIFGYKIMDFAATWFVKWYWCIDAIQSKYECKCNNCKCNNCINNNMK